MTIPADGTTDASPPSVDPSRPRRRVGRPHRWHDIDPARRGVVLAWLAFTLTFAIARVVTGVIKLGGSSSGNASVGGVHLHHYLWGILLVSGTAVFGLVDRSARARSLMGVALGIGLGLIVDEAALLITLKDVYWHTQGWISVAIAVIIISVLGTMLVITRSGRYEDDPDRR